MHSQEAEGGSHDGGAGRLCCRPLLGNELDFPAARVRSTRMMWTDFLTALSLALVFEGILPFLSPERARDTFAMMASVDDKSMRMLGLSSMLVGVVVLYLVR